MAAATAGSSCVKAASPKNQLGSVRGVVSNSKGGGLSAVTVTATPDSGGKFVTTTDSSGDFLLIHVPAGVGSIALTNVGASCTAPAPVTYAVLATDTTELHFTVTCIITLP
jgi:hypothetical protein